METSEKYKLYKVTVEKQLVVVAPARLSKGEVECSIPNLMVIHADSLMHEPNSFVLAEEIKDLGELPEGWTAEAIPYINEPSYTMLRELVDKTIQQYLSENNDTK